MPFGHFIVNKFRLKDGHLMLRTPSGGSILKLPSQRINNELSLIIHKVAGGSIPSFEDMSNLTTTDKNLLHDVINHSHITHVVVPKPDLTKLEQDLHRFEVLRGECSSGNSSVAVVKELKHLIVKLMNQNKLPRREACEVLIELAQLGQ